MSCGIAYNISACRGATASLRVHWGVHPVVSKAITGISNSPNALVTAPDHGLTDSWPVVVTNVRGMKEINWPQQDPWGAPATLCKVVDSDTLELTGVNTSDYTAYTGGGWLHYWSIPDTSGLVARFVVVDRKTRQEVLTLESGAISPDGSVDIGTPPGACSVVIAAEATDRLHGKPLQYTLRFTNSIGMVYSIAAGQVKIG